MPLCTELEGVCGVVSVCACVGACVRAHVHVCVCLDLMDLFGVVDLHRFVVVTFIYLLFNS